MSDDQEEESPVLRELRDLNRANERLRRWHRPQSGYFDEHPDRDAYQEDQPD